MSDEVKPREWTICKFCQNTGVHLCPDVAEPIVIRCSNKLCPVTQHLDAYDALKVENERLRAMCEKMTEVLRFYGREEKILGGSDYQMYATSSYRQATDDNGKHAREALAEYGKLNMTSSVRNEGAAPLTEEEKARFEELIANEED